MLLSYLIIIMFIINTDRLNPALIEWTDNSISQYKSLSLPSLITDCFMSFRRNREFGQADKEMSAGHVPPDG